MKIENILITGAAGFIGRQLVEKLLKENINVFQFDDLSQKPLVDPHDELVIEKVQNITSDYLNDKNISKVIHLAAKKNVKDSFYNLDNSVENFEMTFKLLNACSNSQVKNVFLASTCEIFGFQEKKLNEQAAFNPHSPYAVSKVANEYISNVYMMLEKSLRITSLNFFNTYGPTEGTDAVIPNFISKAVGNEKIIIEGDGNQGRDFTYIDDTIDLITKIILSKKYFRSLNIGSGNDTNINKIIEILGNYFKNLNYKHVRGRPNEVNTFIADNTLIKKEFGFTAKVSIEDGIKKVIEHYKKMNA